MDVIHDDEENYIRRYQYAKQYLPLCKTVAGLTPVDFDISAYPEFCNDRLAALDCYLKELKPYTIRLVKAAQFRQEHYDAFIANKRIEEIGHQKWRIEMNKLAKECQSMLTYWQNERELAFDEACYAPPTCNRVQIDIDINVKNVEYDITGKKNKYSVTIPRLPLNKS
jgi:hypothetical protein